MEFESGRIRKIGKGLEHAVRFRLPEIQTFPADTRTREGLLSSVASGGKVWKAPEPMNDVSMTHKGPSWVIYRATIGTPPPFYFADSLLGAGLPKIP